MYTQCLGVIILFLMLQWVFENFHNKNYDIKLKKKERKVKEKNRACYYS